jgi:capping protein alpha
VTVSLLILAVVDIRAIVDPNAGVTEASYMAGYERYNNKEMIAVSYKEQQVLLSAHGMVESGRYMDPRHGVVLKVDSVYQEVRGEEPLEDAGAEPELRAALDEALQAHCAEYFAEGAVCAVYPDLTMCVSARIYAPQKAWSGRWQSVYKYVDGTLSGSVDINIHYYEFGNINKTAHFDTVPIKVDADAESIIAAIRDADVAYHKMCTEDAANMKEQFKSLLRQLPITKSKIDWLKIHNESKVKGELEGLK